MEDQEKNTTLSSFLTPLFTYLKKNKCDYCICGNYQNLPYHTDNDVDIWAMNTTEVTTAIKKIAIDNGFTLYLENKNATGSNLFFWKKTNEGPATVHLDVLSECRWLSFLPLAKSKYIRNHTKTHNEFIVATRTIDAAMHFMHPLTHFGAVREKYYDDFTAESNNEDFWKILETGLGKNFCRKIKPYFIEKNWTAIEHEFQKNKVKILLHTVSQMRLVHIKSFFQFISSNIQRLFKPNGIFIAFIGPDGCGKTTVQHNLQPFFKKGFTKGKIRMFYWRPFVLPLIKALIPGVKKQKKADDADDPSVRLKLRNVGLAKQSIHTLKLFYYCLDFMLGKLKYQSVWSRGGVVCFDRYWNDLLVFPERFGLHVSQKFVRPLSFFVVKPDIIFYLHAEAEVLTARKLELPLDEMARQIHDYKEMSLKHKNIKLIKADMSENEVVNAIITSCLEKMSQRYS